jgi:uroporphyrinogen decarboxylase
MNSRQREMATILRQSTDRISIDAICVENEAAVAAYLGIEPTEVVKSLGLDGRIVAAPYTGAVVGGIEGLRMTEWGTQDTGDYGTTRPYPLADASTKIEIDGYPIPNPDNYDYAAAAQAARSLGDYAVRGPYWKPLFCQVCDLVGMEEAMVKMMLEPAVFEGLLERIFEHTIDYCARLLDACGENMPIFCLGDDFATQRGMMISPAKWRKFLKPRFARLFDIGKSRGKPVWFHSCGDITSILPDLIDIGMDVWETVQLHTLPLSPAKLKQEYGRHITFFGGVSTQRLPFITPGEVSEEVKRCIDILGRDGGYICGPDHHIKPDVSAENTVMLFETAKHYHQML